MGNEAFQGSHTARVVPFPRSLSHGLGVPTVLNAVMPESSSLAVWRPQPVLPDLHDARLRLGMRPLRYKKGSDQVWQDVLGGGIGWMIICSKINEVSLLQPPLNQISRDKGHLIWGGAKQREGVRTLRIAIFALLSKDPLAATRAERQRLCHFCRRAESQQAEVQTKMPRWASHPQRSTVPSLTSPTKQENSKFFKNS